MATMVECLDCDDLEARNSKEVICVGVESAVPSQWRVDPDRRLEYVNTPGLEGAILVAWADLSSIAVNIIRS
jgi:hypothetical protein